MIIEALYDTVYVHERNNIFRNRAMCILFLSATMRPLLQTLRSDLVQGSKMSRNFGMEKI